MRFLALIAALAALSLPAVAQSTLLSFETPNPEFINDYGTALADVGDVDGDGVPDLLVGASFEDAAFVDAGRAYLYSGATGALLRTLTSPTPTSQANFGQRVLGPGDLNGDGVPDLLISAPSESIPFGPFFIGRVHAISGADGSPLYVSMAPTPSEFGGFGGSIALAGDLDGDGVTDFFAGAAGEDIGGQSKVGRAYAVSGADGTPLRTFNSPTPEAFGRFGASVAGAGDLDGDGVPDLLVGTFSEDAGGPTFSGRAHVLSGATGAAIYTLSSPNAQNGGSFGATVAGGRDVTGDAVPDLLITALEESTQGGNRAGRVYVFSGATGTLVRELMAPNGGYPDGEFGFALTFTGDLNGDGVPDVLASAPAADGPDGAPVTGFAITFSGATGEVLYVLSSPGGGPTFSSFFGDAVAAVSDIDGDGVDELFIGAPVEFSGRAYLFSGATDAAPQADFSSTCQGLTCTFTDTSSGATFRRWTWRFGDGSLGRGKTVTHTYPAAGDYTVRLVAIASDRTPYATSQVVSVSVAAACEDASGACPNTATLAAGAGAVGAANVGTNTVPHAVTLKAFPNPFHASTSIRFTLEEATAARLVVYDAVGHEVARLVDGHIEAGAHEVRFEGERLPSGVYFARFMAESGIDQTQRLTLTK